VPPRSSPDHADLGLREFCSRARSVLSPSEATLDIYAHISPDSADRAGAATTLMSSTADSADDLRITGL